MTTQWLQQLSYLRSKITKQCVNYHTFVHIYHLLEYVMMGVFASKILEYISDIKNKKNKNQRQ